MKFAEEPTGYEKTILSDLQGAWIVFRQAVVDTGGFNDWDRVLFHTDEAMMRIPMIVNRDSDRS